MFVEEPVGKEQAIPGEILSSESPHIKEPKFQDHNYAPLVCTFAKFALNEFSVS